MTAEYLPVVLLSLKASFLAVLMMAPGAIFFGWLLAMKEFAGKTLVDSIIHIPMVLPPITIGYGLLLLFGKNGILGGLFYSLTGQRIAFTGSAVVIAAMAVSFPLFVRSVRTAFEMQDSGLVEASRVLGKGPLVSWLSISLPLALPGVAAGAALGLARALGEFGATAAFAGNIPGVSRTLPLAIWTALQTPGGEVRAGWLSLVSVVLAFGTFLISGFFSKKLRRNA